VPHEARREFAGRFAHEISLVEDTVIILVVQSLEQSRASRPLSLRPKELLVFWSNRANTDEILRILARIVAAQRPKAGEA